MVEGMQPFARGQLEPFVAVSYVVLLGVVGTLMLIESVKVLRAAAGKAGTSMRRGGQHTWLDGLPLKLRFRHSRIYASLIFERTRPVAEALLQKYRFAEVGGTGWDVVKRLEDIGITTKQQDYGLYPHYSNSIGFTQRGCRLRCKFCVVPRKEGAVVEEQTITDI